MWFWRDDWSWQGLVVSAVMLAVWGVVLWVAVSLVRNGHRRPDPPR